MITIRISGGSVRLNYNNLNNLNPIGYTIFNNTADTINARDNYWFTVDTNVIAQKIYDFEDDSTKGRVNYRPFLNGPLGTEDKRFSFDAKYSLSKIYPNPAKRYFTVRDLFGACRLWTYRIRIYDVTGKVIREEKITGSKTEKILLDGIKNGIYFVQVNDEMTKVKLIVIK
ncbi:MAG: T9SS type A sorting domain-containing protein [candidate division WOR-3 bacterium]|nr:T9SS type A sorting domain-containing protein [candidate division WOR-3 bacterium]